MRSVRGLLALGMLALSTLPAHAQGYLVGPNYGYGGFTYTRQTRHSLFTLTVGGFAGPSYAVSGTVYGPVYGYGGPVFVPQPVVIVQEAPPPVLVVPARPSVVVVDQLALDVLPREFLQGRGAVLPPEPPPRVVRREAPLPPPRLPPPGDLPRPPLPLDDPKAEHVRLVEAGRDAFAVQEYGRAADRFRQATRLVPTAPHAHFLLAEALFALGKYPQADDALFAGLLLRPDWPTNPAFQPRDLYGPNGADFTDQRRRLDDALARLPGDPFLLFLSAYHVWFDGRRDEARGLFRRALAAGADRNAVDCFLRVAAGPIVARR